VNRRIKKLAISLHRWLGVTFCLLFAWWFVSGIFMMYGDFPRVSAVDRLARAPVLDASRIHVDPEAAYKRLEFDQPPDQLRLHMYDGRPAYRFRLGRDQFFVYADNGQVESKFSMETMLRVAAVWSGQPERAARMEFNTEEDQWTVSGEFRRLRPLIKYSWPDGQQVYVSTVTGEVVQATTRSSRILAHLGPIPHWLYYTSLRKHGPLWSRVVILLSGVATIAALLGIIVGLWMYSPSKRYSIRGESASIPYTGQKRWHMIAGLFFGIVACTWAFSGMLSLDPFPLPQPSEEVGARIASALRGGPIPLAEFAAKPAREALAQLGAGFAAKELEFTWMAGDLVYLASGRGAQTQIVPLAGGPVEALDRNLLFGVMRRAARPFRPTEVRLVTKYEAYYIDRHERRPLPVIFLKLNDGANSMYYVDPKTARVVESYDAATRVNRWLYQGLHSLDFPWLYAHRPLWDIVVLILMLGGVALSVTSVILAVRVVGRVGKLWHRAPLREPLFRARI
jgi:hypothetical protein